MQGALQDSTRYLVKDSATSSQSFLLTQDSAAFKRKQSLSDPGLKCFMNEMSKPGLIRTVLDYWETCEVAKRHNLGRNSLSVSSARNSLLSFSPAVRKTSQSTMRRNR